MFALEVRITELNGIVADLEINAVHGTVDGYARHLDDGVDGSLNICSVLPTQENIMTANNAPRAKSNFFMSYII